MLADPEDQGNPAPQVAIHEVLGELCRVMPYLARDEHRTLRIQLNDGGVLLRSLGFKPLIERGELPPSSPKGLAGLGDWLPSKTDDFELVKQLATPPSTLDLQQVITALEAQNRKNLAEAKASVGK